MPGPIFKTARKLANKTAAYFRQEAGNNHLHAATDKNKKLKAMETEPVTLTGLALFLGFESRQQMEDYEQDGEFGYIIKRGRLQIEAQYEKKLHQQSASGAMFALKNMGWKDKTDDRSSGETRISSLTIEIVESGPALASNEAEVVL